MKEIFEKKSKIYQSIRDYFYKTGAIEVFTDILLDYPNLDSNIYPVELFVFNEKKEKIRKFLHTSPEPKMKKIISQIKSDIFQITKVFRNFEGSYKHKIEFTMLEWYRVNYNLEDLMEDTKNIFIETAISLYRKPFITYKGKNYDLTNWEKITVDDAFYRYTKIYPDNIEKMNEFLKQNEPYFKGSDNWEELFFHIYAFYVEPNLGLEKPIFVYDYPPQLSAFAKVENGKGKRFEAYIHGIELVNGYDELNNPQELEKRLLKDIEIKKKEGFDYPLDTEFIQTVKNLPQSAGASLGLDRFIMVFLDLESVHL
ncbi:elongation factor P--(R)-beta-lysine ligase [Sulfurihydrogenibium subterraneum]|uniref:elongation factor P--(R)-beta-lysine ligase n=1 Tax=Sulfurihydrogenibium subterraneum TaxID=171121 RepID=UPI00048DF4E1|nr:elongation factor P--(R)-beta-lysine ligase [Sulfurihydrogenibium subterraneum]